MGAKHKDSLEVEQTLDKAVVAVKDLKPDATYAVDGTVYTLPELVAKLESLQSIFGGARELRRALFALVLKRDEAQPGAVAFLASLRGVLVGIFGTNSPEIERFGFKLRKQRPPLTAEQALARATKARATRLLRHTMGPKQKAAIKAEGTPIIKAVMPDETAPSAPSAGPTDGASAPAAPLAAPQDGKAS